MGLSAAQVMDLDLETKDILFTSWRIFEKVNHIRKWLGINLVGTPEDSVL
jgi:hypothetical protein